MENILKDGIARIDIFHIWRSVEDIHHRNDIVIKTLFENTDLKNCSESTKHSISRRIQSFCSQLKSRWSDSHRVLAKFQSRNKTWLEGKITFEDLVSLEENDDSNYEDEADCSNVSSTGRPRKSFAECSDSSKRKRVKDLVQSIETDELCFAAHMSLHLSGQRSKAEIVKNIISSSTECTKNIKEFVFESDKKLPTKISVDEALAFYIDNRLTKRQYISLYQQTKLHKANIYPSYPQLLNGKKECYPQNVLISEGVGEVPLQALVDHTVQRLITAQVDVIRSVKTGSDLIVYFKWGCDGASGQSRYKQTFRDDGDETDDSFVFILSLVPLHLKPVTHSSQEQNQVFLWKNPLPSSTKYCRPIKVMFKKETKELAVDEIQKVEEQIENLIPTTVIVEGEELRVVSKLQLTMMDGKICSNLADASLQNCYVCGATPKLMNDLQNIRTRPIQKTTLSFGLSTLHAWIKCFECLLHISYRLDVKTWQVKGADKETVKTRKEGIQERFRREMGLLVDIPKPGFGSTNDGNTARRFFSNPSLSAEITGVNKGLIERFDVILRTISCGFEVNASHFEKYCWETAEQYVVLYNWYYMPQTVHKILVHGGQIIASSILPIGQLSEEAQEARNKDTKYFRQFNTRKCSRKKTMEDLFHMLLVSSDPLISSYRIKHRRRASKLPSAVLSLLQVPEEPKSVEVRSEESETDNSDSD